MTDGDKMTNLPPMRLISCAATTQAVINRTKTVTRRWGWGTDKIVKVGDCLRVINKSRRNYSQPESITLACVEVVRVDRVPLLERVGTPTVNDAGDVDEINPARAAVYASLDVFIDHDTPCSWGTGYSAELTREGCGHMSPPQFIDLLAGMAPKHPTVLTRIEWVYREDLFEAWRASKGVRT